MGTPVVASAVGGLAEMISHCENGMLVRPNDAQALADAIAFVLNDPLLKETIIHGALETVQPFDIDYHVKRLVAIYNAMAMGQPIPPREKKSKVDGSRPVETQSSEQPDPAPTTSKTP